jgi:DNA-binding transcriptional LysR family regulator
VRIRVEVNNWNLLLAHLRAEAIEFFVADIRDLPRDETLDILPLGRQAAGFYVRDQHPLAEQACTVAGFWPHGVATTRLPPVVKAGLATLLGLPAGQAPGLALECDDIALLCAVALATDTVLGVTDAAAHADVAAGRLIPLRVTDLPALYSEMGVVSLRQRSASPMARRAIELIVAVAGKVNTVAGIGGLIAGGG